MCIHVYIGAGGANGQHGDGRYTSHAGLQKGDGRAQKKQLATNTHTHTHTHTHAHMHTKQPARLGAVAAFRETTHRLGGVEH